MGTLLNKGAHTEERSDEAIQRMDRRALRRRARDDKQGRLFLSGRARWGTPGDADVAPKAQEACSGSFTSCAEENP